MRVAAFSDVQANLPAMEVAVDQILRWQPDLVVMAGDLVNRGPKSLPCLALFEEFRRNRGWLPVKGNHEVWVLRCGREGPTSPLDAEMRRFVDWTYRQIEPMAACIEDWPDHLCFSGGSDNTWVHVTHGTLAGNRHGITAQVPEEDVKDSVPDDVAVFVTGHTHRPLTRMIGPTPVLNVGSVGSPFDGDVRGSYALMELRNDQWQWEIVRFDYDRAQAERDFRESGFIEDGGPIARILFEEWHRARLLMPLWRRDYEPAVLAGERPLEPAVSAFLASLD